MSVHACLIDSPSKGVYPLENGSTAAYLPLSDARLGAWLPKDHSVPVLILPSDARRVLVGAHQLNGEILELVIEAHGPCVWAHSLAEVKAFARDGSVTKSPILWAWDGNGVLRCIAAACVSRAQREAS